MARIGKPVRAFFMDFAKESHVSVNLCPPHSRVPVLPGNTSGFFVDAMLRGSACRL